MLRIDGAYLYELGAVLREISRLPEKDQRLVDLYFTCLTAQDTLEALFGRSVFTGSLRSSEAPASKLLVELRKFVPDITQEEFNWEEPIPPWSISHLKREFSKFETVLTAELQGSALYFVSAKGGFDTLSLTDFGENLFPASLAQKVPSALSDVRAGARCLAFELPTAAGFHFHRANESVLRRYFDEVAGESRRPRSRNMGDYIKIMKEVKVGDPKVLEVLQSLKDLHRNPLMHPDQSIETLEDAISLQSAVRAAIGYMLDRIPEGAIPAVIDPLPLDDPADGT